ncbi:hypothetical protein GCM10023210_40430 [Chryseobacterium ginsengisoli]|uniref:DUF4783 domain-containing protein n=1 Tax=Chryseobacterium ginsengisoli TaxID=363853 RepID=A0ABP9MSS3_9FLAO
MKKIIIASLLLISAIFYTQKKVETILTNGNGKVLKTKSSVKYTLEETINQFYKRIDDASKLDNFMSFRFYQKTPYSEFKEWINTKSKKYGAFQRKKLIDEKFAPDNMAVRYIFEVKYAKGNLREILILSKETGKDNFQVYEYNISEIK